MARDLSDPWAEIRALKERVRILETATPLQDASVTRGRLRVASADGFVAEAVAGGAPAVRVTGLQVVDGVLRITGTLEGSGTWSWSGTLTQTGTTNLNGPWNLNGVGTIAGNVTATGTLTQNGPWNLVGVGTITGDVTQTGNTTQQGSVTVTGSGKITVGGMVIDPADGGKVTFPGGAELRADVGNGIQMQIGTVKISAQAGAITLSVGTRSIGISSSGIRAALPTTPIASWPGRAVGDVVSNTTGDLFRVA